jgi:hypothetical protein
MNNSTGEMAQFIFETSKAARDEGILSIWTVYDHPKDYPDTFVARRHAAGQGTSGPTGDVVIGDIAMIREAMQLNGFFRMPRAPADDLRIVETWM